jgi:hypothetical protein
MLSPFTFFIFCLLTAAGFEWPLHWAAHCLVRGLGLLGGPLPRVMARRACAQHCAEPHMPAQCGTPFQGDRAAFPRSGQGSATGSSAALSLFPRLSECVHGYHYISALGQSVGWRGGLTAMAVRRNRCLLRSNRYNYSIGYPTCLDFSKFTLKCFKLLTN